MKNCINRYTEILRLKSNPDKIKEIKEVCNITQKGADNYLRVFGTQRDNEKKEKDKKNNVDINLNEKNDNIIQIH